MRQGQRAGEWVPGGAGEPFVRVVEGALSREECRRVVDLMAGVAGQAGPVLRKSADVVDVRMRHCREHMVGAQEGRVVVAAMVRVASEVHAGVGEEIRLDGPKFCSYSPGEYFRAHRDRSADPHDPPAVRARRLTVVCVLNDTEPDGGLPVFDGGGVGSACAAGRRCGGGQGRAAGGGVAGCFRCRASARGAAGQIGDQILGHRLDLRPGRAGRVNRADKKGPAMRNLHDDVNERLEVRVTDDVLGAYRPELAGFLGACGLGRLLEEVFVPLAGTARTRTAVAYEERPWPPAGVGARALRGLGLAVVSEDGQALLTPVILTPQHRTNIGLSAALLKILLEDLGTQDIDWVAVFVNQRSQLVAGELASVGFEPREARVVTGQAEFTAYAGRPADVLERLGLGGVRLGDVLALNLERPLVTKLAALQFALAEGVKNYWADDPQWAEVFPGLIDWAALPPGGITGTPGPGVDPIDPVIVIPR
ncbi:hypothetical protein ABGB17_06450 [Sphaerisporangium sp. B11E5]|uniref:hypothetical protein n=1 Tax=Sphaerisporangium sp. B11E5 TaxID=3153563 RepID=UPI00325F19B7